MGFKKALTAELQDKLFMWKTELIGEEVVITIPDQKILLVQKSFSTILWLIVPEVLSKPVPVSFILLNESKTIRVHFDFNP